MSNKGKKYIKLQGHEVATLDSKKRARAFMGWFGLRFEELRKNTRNFDDEVAVDTALTINDAILLRGLVITGKYRWYFLRAYHTNLIGARKKERERAAMHTDIDDEYNLVAPDYDFAGYESATDTLREEMLDFVRRFYDPYSVSLFEIYMELQPDISYKRLSDMLGIPARHIWPVLGAIKKDLAHWFGDRKEYLLSAID